jgi:hypothetical protein
MGLAVHGHVRVPAWKTPASPARSLLARAAMYITAIKSPTKRILRALGQRESALTLRLFGEGTCVRSPERGDGEKGFI